MSDAMVHRGPDDKGALVWNGEKATMATEAMTLRPGQAGFIHRRLSILDLSEAGRQPMATADGRFHIIFNGEIYNYIELRTELQQAGYEFSTETDTEVLLKAYAAWGKACLNRLTGMFAFAVLDTKNRSVFLARDHFGIKPLYWYTSSGMFAFASEIKGLTATGVIPISPNPQSLYQYLQHGRILDSEQTVYKDILHLPPAHCALINLDTPNQIKPERYWEIDTNTVAKIDFGGAVEETKRLFIENIRLHLRSDVPLGAALSGGIDSSAITSCMRHVSPNTDLHAFSFVPDDPAISEENWIDMAGESCGAQVHKIRIGVNDLSRDIDALLRAHDEPFLNTGMYAQYRVMQKAKETGIKVMLDGQGGDELLAGYQRFYGTLAASHVRKLRLNRAAKLWNNVKGMHRVTPATVFAPLILHTAPKFMTDALRSVMRRSGPHPWLDTKWFEKHDVVMQETPKRLPGPYVLREDLKRSIEHDLPQLLRYEDRNSMAHSIESRVPFLTPKLTDFLFSLPEEYLISEDGTNKNVFRQAMRDLVPDAILDRKDKVGFPTPEHKWLDAMRPWLKSNLEGKNAKNIPFHNAEQIAKEWTVDIRPNNYGSGAWRWASVIRWTELNNVDFSSQ